MLNAIKLLLFLIGWISGGGICTFIAMWLLGEVLGIKFPNEWFVVGCLWGTFGVFMGRFMVSHAATHYGITGEKPNG